ncbi:SgcJ/EcaC family oxidoreductase [Streptomyces sp. TRM70350]|uniref:SgcJ/EcaC family oxidoreductase n=1 Tax=Streptomyces sp. TRM70350 TaxID=2856165 RepID=UPI001C48A0A7|nr:SgcJ/EcaC family oxidoreductase [Streptomyces sp. TRM70350]MBV7696119.1 SgcJ/EcaC family oxidoreductase [Streptomyces sp. TRM70350]
MNRKTRIRAAVVTATALVATATVTAGVGVAEPWWGGNNKATKAEIAGLFDDWNAALQTGDPQKVADLYAKDAVLLPTVSNKVRTDRAGIVDYFEHFLQNKPVGTKVQTIVKVLDSNSALDTGVYQFALTDHETGEKRTVTARYTYEYEKLGGQWKIVNHHSSAMPEG